MKKALYTTSALAGAALLASSPAVAGEAPEVTFSGALAYESIFNDGDMQAGGTGYTIQANEQQSEFVWDAHGTADNGLEYGANVQWRWAGNGSGAGAFDESWIDFKGSWGRLFIGAEDGVEDLVAGTAGHSVQVGTWGTDGNNALRNVNFLSNLGVTAHYYQSAAHFTSDANKIGYTSPSFGGFSVGIGFTPDGSQGQSSGASGENNGQNNVTSVAAGWSGEFGDVSLGIDGSYGVGEDDSGTGGADNEDISAYQLGAIVGFAGFSVAGQYFDNDDSNCVQGVTGCEAESGWNLGALYDYGAGGISVMYQETEDDRDGDGNENQSEIFHAGVDYQIAEGLKAYLNGYWFDLEDAQAGTSNDATVVILGTRVTF